MAAAAPLDRAIERLGRWILNRRGYASRYVPTNSGLLHVYDKSCKGHGRETVVFLHGITSGATPFGRLMKIMEAHVKRVIAPEALGHGFSESPDNLHPDRLFEATSEFLNNELNEPAVIYGNSMGGAIALRYAVENPEKVRALILCSPAGAQMDADAYSEFLGRLIMTQRSQARDFVNALFHKTPWYSAIISRFIYKRFNRKSIRSLLDQVTMELMLDPEKLAGLNMPLMLLWGQSERLLPEENLAFFENHLPSHALVKRPDCMGHVPHLEIPLALSEHIRGFLAQLP